MRSLSLPSTRWAWAFGTAVLLLWVVLAALRTPPSVVWADEATFLAMTESLARDGDLRFEVEDRTRIEAAGDGRGDVILQRIDGAIYYSKPVVLPLLAAPLEPLFG
ncbi:MAG: hypothetical protein AAGN46_11000, partial [Acidobacteriota bacterium]